MTQTSVWMLLAAVLVGFSAAWLVFETRHAWSPESLHSNDHGSTSSGDADSLRQLMPTLVDQVAQLRREIADVRAAELEAALRTRKRLLEANAEAGAEAAAEVNVTADPETEPLDVETPNGGRTNGNGTNGGGSNGAAPKNPFPKFEAPSRIPPPHEVDIRWRPMPAEPVHDR